MSLQANLGRGSELPDTLMYQGEKMTSTARVVCCFYKSLISELITASTNRKQKSVVLSDCLSQPWHLQDLRPLYLQEMLFDAQSTMLHVVPLSLIHRIFVCIEFQFLQMWLT